MTPNKQARYRERQLARGLVEVKVWVYVEQREKLLEAAERIRRAAPRK